MGTEPLISVCIPAYNNGDFIAATLNSVLRQTYPHLEIIITDDHSSDNTVAVLNTFSDPRVRLFCNEVNLGLAGNWNNALSRAAGKYVKVMGADDLLYPDCLRLQAQALEDPANHSAVLAICSTDVINARDGILLQRNLRFAPGLAEGPELLRKSVRWGTNLIGEPVVGLFRRDVLTRSGGFAPGNPYMIDLAFWAALLKHGRAFLDRRRLAAFRISSRSVSATVGFKHAAFFRSFARSMHTDPFYRAGRLDLLLGTIFSLQWCILRNLLINLRAGTPIAQQPQTN